MPGVRILLVEDDEVLRDLLRRNLAARGHEVFSASDGETALVYLQAMPFDLVVLDINLPDQTGWELLRNAQREGWLHPLTLSDGRQKLPVVVLSAVRVSLSRLTEFHPLAYLPKPFPMEAVLRLATEASERRSGASVTEEEVEAYQNALSNEEELHA
ncbi:MAG TPA: response regulator [Ktedonobacteraceae bacterium]|nr:response regulator [Ktedonobacteraceae bacterium]